MGASSVCDCIGGRCPGVVPGVGLALLPLLSWSVSGTPCRLIVVCRLVRRKQFTYIRNHPNSTPAASRPKNDRRSPPGKHRLAGAAGTILQNVCTIHARDSMGLPSTLCDKLTDVSLLVVGCVEIFCQLFCLAVFDLHADIRQFFQATFVHVEHVVVVCICMLLFV